MLRRILSLTALFVSTAAFGQSLESGARSVTLTAIMLPKPALEAVQALPIMNGLMVQIGEAGPCRIEIQRTDDAPSSLTVFDADRRQSRLAARTWTTIFAGWCQSGARHAIDVSQWNEAVKPHALELNVRVVTGRGEQVRVVTLRRVVPLSDADR